MINHFETYTVENVTSGHPDKICDQVSDAVLDECLAQDSRSRVAIECLGSHGLLVLGGEITSEARLDYKKLVDDVFGEIGYNYDELNILSRITRQSPDIAQGVDKGGAGDQGIMYGYATEETADFLPLGIVLGQKLTRELEHLRKSGELPWLLPDGKVQLTMGGREIKTILVSAQHKKQVSQEEIRQSLIEKLLLPVVGDLSSTEILTNPSGMFRIGGFDGDTGLTGRKIMVDSYGGLVPHGGGCFSGKDPTKVDRSGAYMCRFAAKNIVASGQATECLVSVAYAIGREEPVMLAAVDGNGKKLDTILKDKFDFRPLAIIERLNLRRPIYRQTATYGHFGREGLPWEELLKDF